MEISIKLLDINCSEELYNFELINREYFERTCPSRGENYYNYDNFKDILKELILDIEKGLSYMYLVYDTLGNIVGRVNLVNVEDSTYKKAELGYRIGEIYKGKGYGSKAVELILNEALEKHNINEVYAGTSTLNIPSQKVLINNGFNSIENQGDSILVNGVWHENIEFYKKLK